MANFLHRFPNGVPGRFYVDDSCIYCALCVETAPTVFRYEAEYGWALVFHQPTTEEELHLTLEAVEGCPDGSIGTDGDCHDWEAVPSRWGRVPPPTDGSRGVPPDQQWRFR